jgi:hypothetical protein
MRDDVDAGAGRVSASPSSRHRLLIAMTEEMFERLRTQARTQDVPPAILARIYISRGLREHEGQAA